MKRVPSHWRQARREPHGSTQCPHTVSPHRVPTPCPRGFVRLLPIHGCFKGGHGAALLEDGAESVLQSRDPSPRRGYEAKYFSDTGEYQPAGQGATGSRVAPVPEL